MGTCGQTGARFTSKQVDYDDGMCLLFSDQIGNQIFAILQGERVTVHLIAPNHPITDEELSLVHSDKFLKAVKHSRQTIVNTSEVCLLYLLPMCAIESHLVRPLRYQTTGIGTGKIIN